MVLTANRWFVKLPTEGILTEKQLGMGSTFKVHFTEIKFYQLLTIKLQHTMYTITFWIVQLSKQWIKFIETAF